MDYVMVDGTVLHDLVPKNYQFNPDTEDVIWAEDLRNGMIIVATAEDRLDNAIVWEDPIPLLRENRWCEVTRLRFGPSGFMFIGKYSDGNKLVRHCSTSKGWIVKKGTIPVELNEEFLTSGMSSKWNDAQQ